MTFNELTEWYLALEKVKSRAYYPTLTINLNSFNEEFGDIVVNQVMPIDLENYQAKRQKAGYADSYIDQAIGAARAMVTKAFYNDLVGERTLKKFKMVKKLLKRNANARDRILHRDEYNKLIAVLPAHTKAIITTAFHTGMRSKEILTLTWDKVDLKERIIRLNADVTKDKEPRKIDIDNELYEMLKDIPRAIHDNHVFLYKGKPISCSIRRSLKTACAKVGITYGRFEEGGFIPHDLRHTFVTYARKAGVAQSVIMKTTGHSTTEMFHRYNTVDNEDTREGINQFEDYIKSVDQTVDQEEKRG
jgi:integrase